MQTIIKALRSRTVWTVALMFIIGGTNAITGIVPESLTTPILFFLGVLAAYFKITPSQEY